MPQEFEFSWEQLLKFFFIYSLNNGGQAFKNNFNMSFKNDNISDQSYARRNTVRTFTPKDKS